MELLGAERIGHGVRAAEDPDLLARLVDAEVALEVCPASNVSLGVYRSAEEVPLRQLYDAGARIALGADDPLLFGSRLAEQYETLAHHYVEGGVWHKALDYLIKAG